MDENLIRKYAALMRELELSALEINENGASVRLERGTVSAAAPVLRTEVSAPAPLPAASALTEITSPMIGVFYASPSEESEPFVAPGAAVKRGDVICIIEAMKLMNEITAEADGVITEICVENGQTVDFGRVLFKMKEAGR